MYKSNVQHLNEAFKIDENYNRPKRILYEESQLLNSSPEPTDTQCTDTSQILLNEDSDLNTTKLRSIVVKDTTDARIKQKEDIDRLVALVDEIELKFNVKKKVTIPKYLKCIWRNCDYWSEALAGVQIFRNHLIKLE